MKRVCQRPRKKKKKNRRRSLNNERIFPWEKKKNRALNISTKLIPPNLARRYIYSQFIVSRVIYSCRLRMHYVWNDFEKKKKNMHLRGWFFGTAVKLSLSFRFSALPESDRRREKVGGGMTIRSAGRDDITGTRQEVDRFLGPANIISYNDIFILIMLDFLISTLSLLLLLLFFFFFYAISSRLIVFFFFSLNI